MPVQTHDEIRPVTFLFADIVGSTGLGERLAAEEVKALVGECVNRMSRAVEEHGGRVQSYLGDGICAFFGVPVAHEDDPERAAHTALRIQAMAREYREDVAKAWQIQDFDVRIGINTGRVAVGLIGASDAAEVALGDAPNVAARLQTAADPGEIWVGEATARQLRHRFQLEPLGVHQLKGRDEPVSAWRLVRLLPEEGTPAISVVGRNAELAQLSVALRELTQARRGQFLLLTGETGLGKTRLIEELRGRAADETTWIEGHCLSYGGTLAAPFVEALRRWLRIEEDEGEIVARTRAQARLGDLFGSHAETVLPALGRLLGLRLSGDGGEQYVSPADSAEEIRAAYVAWLEALSADTPVVLAIEDVHWLDAPGRELAERILALLDRRAILFLVTLRLLRPAEGGRLRLHALGEHAHRSSELPLQPLRSEDAAHLVQLLAANLDESARTLIVQRSEGNPLYLEELARLANEGSQLPQRAPFTVTAPVSSLLPPALDSVLIARIDALDLASREVAQAAAVIGRQFSRRMLERILGSLDLDTVLASLMRAEIIREAGGSGDREFVFRHGLFQDAALSTLTSSRRRELYAAAATAVEQLVGEAQDSHLEMLAHYYAQSGELLKAEQYLRRAAERDQRLGASDRAAALLERAERAALQARDAQAR